MRLFVKLIVAFLALVMLIFAWLHINGTLDRFFRERQTAVGVLEQATFSIPSVGYTARTEVASTEAQRIRGLSGRGQLDRDSGLLIVFDKLDQHHIWMRGMRFSLDLIWVAGGVVVDTHMKLPVPPEGADPATLPYFNPRPQALMVLEVPAGIVEEYGIVPGQRVEIDLNDI